MANVGQYAEQLVEAAIESLSEPYREIVDKEELANLLATVEFKGEGFSCQLNIQSGMLYIQNNKNYADLILRDLINNSDVDAHKISGLRRKLELMLSGTKKNPRKVWLGSLGADEDMINLFDASNDCFYPFSLLAELRIVDFDNPEHRAHLINRPIVVIPGIETYQQEKVKRWEKQNTKCWKYGGLLRNRLKHIKFDEDGKRTLDLYIR